MQNILGSLGTGDQVVPDTGGVQEINIPYYDSGSLPSPPPSDEEPEETDPLLDFSLDDDLTHTPGKPQIQSQIQAQRALRGMQGIIEGVQERQREKEKERESLDQRGLFSTESSMVVDRRRKKEISPQPPPREPATQPLAEPPRQQTTRPRPSPDTRQPLSEPSVPAVERPRHTEPVPQSRHLPLESRQQTPPTVPPYNPPEGRDPLPLSNRPEYKEKWRKDTHTYDTVDGENMLRNRSQSPTHKEKERAKKSVSPLPREVPLRVSGPVRMKKTPSPQKDPVILRIKKSPDELPVGDVEGYIADVSRKQKSFVPQRLEKAANVTDLQDLSVACRGLPPRGGCGHEPVAQAQQSVPLSTPCSEGVEE